DLGGRLAWRRGGRRPAGRSSSGREGSLVALLIAAAAAAVALAALVWLWITRREVRSRREPRLERVPDRPVVELGGSRPNAPRGVEGRSTSETQTRVGAGKDVRPEPTALLAEPEGPTKAPEVAGAQGSQGTVEPAAELPDGSVGRSEAVVLELLDDDRPDVRRNAVAALAAGGGALALRGLSYAAARDPVVEVRRVAILGIRSLVERRSAPADGGSS